MRAVQPQQPCLSPPDACHFTGNRANRQAPGTWAALYYHQLPTVHRDISSADHHLHTLLAHARQLAIFMPLERCDRLRVRRVAARVAASGWLLY